MKDFFGKKEPAIAERKTTAAKGIDAFLKGILQLKERHQAITTKPTAPIAEQKSSQNQAKPNPVLSFVKQVTATVTNAINGVIDTISNYISRLFSA